MSSSPTRKRKRSFYSKVEKIPAQRTTTTTDPSSSCVDSLDCCLGRVKDMEEAVLLSLNLPVVASPPDKLDKLDVVDRMDESILNWLGLTPNNPCRYIIEKGNHRLVLSH
jgi:hypothetical protein